MNTKYFVGVDLLGAGVGEIKEFIGFAEVKEMIGVESDSISQDDIKPAF